MDGKIHLKILNLLRQKHITQKQLSKIIDTEEAVISRWISGKTMPSLKSLEKLAAALEVSVQDLLNEDFSMYDCDKNDNKNNGKNKIGLSKDFDKNLNKDLSKEIENLSSKVKELEKKMEFKDRQIDFVNEKIKFLEKKIKE